MSLDDSTDKNQPLNLIVLVTTLLTTLIQVTAPAFYSTSPVAWRRYVITGCIVVIWIIVVRMSGTWIGNSM